jgi:hypothetical protein
MKQSLPQSLKEKIKNMTEIDEYLRIANSLQTHYDDSRPEFQTSGEWHYIQSDLQKNSGLIKGIYELGLIEKETSIVDCGIGLGTIMFDLYLQSKEFSDTKFNFTGVEKQQRYIKHLKENLIHMWEGNLELINSDIMDCDFSKWDIIYLFQPFKWAIKAMPLYDKIITESKPGSIILGIDSFNIINYGGSIPFLIEKFKSLERIKVGEWTCVRKIKN